MKYSSILALLGVASAVEHRHHSLVQLSGEPENSVQSSKYDEFGPAEKVQNLMPRRYERSANSNYVDGVRVSRTTYYTQLEDDITPFTYNGQQSASNEDVIDYTDDFKAPVAAPRNLDTKTFTDDLKVLQQHDKEIEEELRKEESDKRFRPTWAGGYSINHSPL